MIETFVITILCTIKVLTPVLITFILIDLLLYRMTQTSLKELVNALAKMI